MGVAPCQRQASDQQRHKSPTLGTLTNVAGSRTDPLSHRVARRSATCTLQSSPPTTLRRRLQVGNPDAASREVSERKDPLSGKTCARRPHSRENSRDPRQKMNENPIEPALQLNPEKQVAYGTNRHSEQSAEVEHFRLGRRGSLVQIQSPRPFLKSAFFATYFTACSSSSKSPSRPLPRALTLFGSPEHHFCSAKSGAQ